MIELELSYMNFLERHLGSNESIVLRRWLKYLSELVGREPEFFSYLNLRVIKRLKFLHIHSQSD